MDLADLLRSVPVVQQVATFADAIQQLAKTAYVSAVTDLPNGNALDLVAKAYDKQLAAKLAVVFVDLTGFKDVNDTYSHFAGDAALRAVGAELLAAAQFHEADAFHRSGDEFVLIVGVESARKVAHAVSERLSKCDVKVPFTPATNRKQSAKISSIPGVRANVGFALPDKRASLEVLIDRADAACSASKFLGTGEPLLWSRKTEKPTSKRRRCKNPKCRATTTLQFLATRKTRQTFSRCASCQTPFPRGSSSAPAPRRSKNRSD